MLWCGNQTLVRSKEARHRPCFYTFLEGLPHFKRDSQHVMPKTEHYDLSWLTVVRAGRVERELDLVKDEGGGTKTGSSKIVLSGTQKHQKGPATKELVNICLLEGSG